MARLPARRPNPSSIATYDAVLGDVVQLLQHARRFVAKSVNSAITRTYWQVGRRIVEAEQSGKDRAGYGEDLLNRLAADLTKRLGRGFGKSNLYQMRAFFLAYPAALQTPDDDSTGIPKSILQTPSGKSDAARRSRNPLWSSLVAFPLPWSHYVQLLALDNPSARQFYEAQALRGGWSVRQLARQIDSQFYERTALSRNKAALLTTHAKAHADPLTPEEEIKDPFVLEFLGLKDEYSESDLEEALIRHLESFLLELGGDFAFIGRQKRLRVGDTWYRVDLIFFHRRLRCLVLIDLKTGAFTHADAGQMHLYCNYAREHWTHEDENPPVGLILTSRADASVAHYALEGLPNKVVTAQYKTTLPDEKLLAQEIERTRHLLESRSPATRDEARNPPKKRRRQ